MDKLQIGIIGTGAIGSSLAALFTGNGYKTTVLGRKPEAFFLSSYDALYETLETRNLVSKEQRRLCRLLISYATEFKALKDADIVFECITEDLEEKFKIYKSLEEACEKFRVLASATSALSPEDLKRGLRKGPEKILVAHPFNPPHLVPFVEIVRSSETPQESVDLVYNFLESCGRKVCIMKKSAPGFIANRLHHAILREAMYMVENGYADPREIEKAMMYSFIPRYTSVGIFEHHDGYGLDMLEKLQNYLYPHLSAGRGAPDLVVNKVKEGALGMKSGRGIYEWNEGSAADFKKRAAEPYWRFFNWNLPS
jgi:3-hydroxybutyryl-CoA dehydrogenase